MPPKASPGGDRKKIVKKTVRRNTPRSIAKSHPTSPPQESPPDPAAVADEVPEDTPSVGEATTKANPASEEGPSEVTPAAEAAPLGPNPAVKEAPPEATLVAKKASLVINPAAEKAGPETTHATEESPLDITPAVEEAKEAAETTSLAGGAQGPVLVANTSTPVVPPSQEVSGQKGAAVEAAVKKTTVRKLMKKRIVVRKVVEAVVGEDSNPEPNPSSTPSVAGENPIPESNPSPTAGERMEGEKSSSGVPAGQLPAQPEETSMRVEKVESGERKNAQPQEVVPETIKVESGKCNDAQPEEIVMKRGKVESGEVEEPQMVVEETDMQKKVIFGDEPSQLEEVNSEMGKIESGVGEDAALKQDKNDGVQPMLIAADEEKGIMERQRRRKTEIFVGGLDKNAKEGDIRKVFGQAGDIVEVRIMMDGQTGKNKGYGFLRYADAAQAKKAVTELKKVEVCGKICGAAPLEGNDTIFLGSIEKTWRKEDIIKIVKEIGVDKIDTVTVMADPKNADLNRGFAFLELETYKDAQKAYKMLLKKDAFGKGRNVKVAWADPLNDPDEEEMQKVRSVYVEGLPSTWGEDQVKERFEKFGMIDRVVLARNIRTAKRTDFAFVNYETREAALSCIELFEKEELTDNGSKINMKVSLAKPVQKGKQNRGWPKFRDSVKDKPATIPRDLNIGVPSSKGYAFLGGQRSNGGNAKSSTAHELVDVLRHQSTWTHEHVGYARGPNMQDYRLHAFPSGKRNFAALGDDSPYFDFRGYPRARLDSSYAAAGSSNGMMPPGMGNSSVPYHQRPGSGYASGDLHGFPGHIHNFQTRQRGPPYYGSHMYPRY